MFRRGKETGTNAQPIRKKIVPGALGVGKVEMIFKEKPKRKSKIIAIILYTTFFSLVYFSFGWSREYLKEKQLIPTVRAVFKILDSWKLDYLTEKKTDLSYFTVPDSKGSIERTESGAKISSPDLIDTMFAQGYLHAVDRLFQMEVYRRASQGRLSELFGNQTIDHDKFSRIMQFSKVAKLNIDHLDKSTYRALEAYVNGINSYLTSESNLAFPLDFQLSHGLFSTVTLEKWTVHDSLSIFYLMSYEWSGAGWEDQLLRYLGNILTTEAAVDSLLNGNSSPHKRVNLESTDINMVSGFMGTTIAIGSKFLPESETSLLTSDFYSTVRDQHIDINFVSLTSLEPSPRILVL